MAVSQEQKDATEKLFTENNWPMILECNEGVHINESCLRDRQCENNSDDNEEPFHIGQDPEADMCPHCLCRPCITSEVHRQLWWAAGPEPAHRLNRKWRKVAYRKFWTESYHRGVWNHPTYRTRKLQALGHDPRHRQYVYHRRDIMQNCVLKLVRGWYPNLPGQPYMGHMWE